MIKKLFLTAAAAFVVASLAALGLRVYLTRGSPEHPAAEQLPNAVIVYCFHGNERCPTCKKIESQTREVLDKSFAVALKDGQLVWRVLNFEKPENAHFKDEYQIVASCIVLVDARSGRAATARNLQQTLWDLADDKEAFTTFVRDEIEKALKTRSPVPPGEGTNGIADGE
jgi:hypothetical protein